MQNIDTDFIKSIADNEFSKIVAYCREEKKSYIKFNHNISGMYLFSLREKYESEMKGFKNACRHILEAMGESDCKFLDEIYNKHDKILKDITQWRHRMKEEHNENN